MEDINPLFDSIENEKKDKDLKKGSFSLSSYLERQWQERRMSKRKGHGSNFIFSFRRCQENSKKSD